MRHAVRFIEWFALFVFVFLSLAIVCHGLLYLARVALQLFGVPAAWVVAGIAALVVTILLRRK